MKKNVDIIAGARPNFMKIAPIIRALKDHAPDLSYRLVHTGQHYDKNMSDSFFDQLRIPKPDVNLNAGSGTQSEQAASIMVNYEALITEKPTDLCLVVGDVTSTMACSVVARKSNIPVAHVEGGLRSYDWSMPEEINRRLTDSISNYFFTTSEIANGILKSEGVEDERIFFVGNTMIDTLLYHMPEFRPPAFWDSLSLIPGSYFVLTLHRPANVDDVNKLEQALTSISEATQGHKVIFPVHPRTKRLIEELENLPQTIHTVEAQPYLEFNYLVKHSKGVITDSGGITEETTVMGIPCFTLRDTTERPETISLGTNTLVGTQPEKLKPAMAPLFEGNPKVGQIPPLWDGKTGERIAKHLQRILPASTSK